MSKPSSRKLRAYRLENKEGQGPFYGEQAACAFLMSHEDPDMLFRAMGYPEPVFRMLVRMGFVFGWRTRASYASFFKPRGQVEARKLGYSCRVYEPDFAIVLPDDQVMFLKPIQARVMENHPVIALMSLADLLTALSQNSRDFDKVITSASQARALMKRHA